MSLKVKICGLTRPEDALLAAEFGADLLGFVFAPSPRRVSPSTVRRILDRLAEEHLRDRIDTVGVFVNASPEQMEHAVGESGIDLVQLHGDEPHDAPYIDRYSWYRAFRIGSIEDVNRIDWRVWRKKRVLFDASVAGSYGGTGQRIDLDVARAAVRSAQRAGKEVFLAGGITPENAAEIVRECRPDGIDLSGGVESAPGIKSAEALHRFFHAIAPYRSATGEEEQR